ncbi:MAG: hypothetical protein ACWGNV_03740 [Bacteroidales bacterium]
MNFEQGVSGTGPSEGFNLRVSVGVLIRVLFHHPVDGQLMLALERTSTLIKAKGKSEVVVRTKPFGGGARILKPDELKDLIGNFNYDSKRSQEEGDFRILINHDNWGKIVALCREHLSGKRVGVIDFSPVRELSEEFQDSLHILITSNDYSLSPGGMRIEDELTPTENVNARGFPTKRIYYLYDAWLESSAIVAMTMENSRKYSDRDLEKMAVEEAKQGGKGRANAMLSLPLVQLLEFYRSVQHVSKDSPLSYRGHQLDGNIPAILGLKE